MKSRHHCVRCNVHCYSLYPTKPSPPNVVLIQFTHKGKAALWWFWPQRALGKEIVTGACPEKEGVNQRFSNPSQASSVKYTWYQKNCVCAFCFNVWGGFWSWWGKNPAPSTCYLSLFSEFLLCQVTFFFSSVTWISQNFVTTRDCHLIKLLCGFGAGTGRVWEQMSLSITRMFCACVESQFITAKFRQLLIFGLFLTSANMYCKHF